jgi:hypothetical protein
MIFKENLNGSCTEKLSIEYEKEDTQRERDIAYAGFQFIKTLLKKGE